jgi:hypothetical protein
VLGATRVSAPRQALIRSVADGPSRIFVECKILLVHSWFMTTATPAWHRPLPEVRLVLSNNLARAALKGKSCPIAERVLFRIELAMAIQAAAEAP